MNFLNYDLRILQTVFACNVPAGAGDKIHKNRSSHGLAFNLNGEKKYIFDNNTIITVKTNDIIFLPENSSYIVDDVIPGECYAINFKTEQNTNFKPFVHHTKKSSKFLDMFISAEKTFVTKKNAYLLKCNAELYSIVYLLISEYNSEYTPDAKKQLILPAVKYIHEHYTENDITVNQLALMCGITESYFRRIFTNIYGLSPVKYINSLKLQRAKEILSQTECTIDIAARLSGFNDIYWFCRFFKKETGFTPTEYRQNL